MPQIFTSSPKFFKVRGQGHSRVAERVTAVHNMATTETTTDRVKFSVITAPYVAVLKKVLHTVPHTAALCAECLAAVL